MNWQPGDRALIIDDGNVWDCGKKMIGMTCTLVCWDCVERAWNLNIDGVNDKNWVADESALRPIYDGNETVSWESMKDIYQPSPVVVANG